MAHPWDAERHVDRSLARTLIEQQFPELRGTAVVAFGEGWDNVAFLVDQRFVFRFPRRAVAVELIQREALVLARIAPLLPVAVPRPLYLGRPSEAFPWPFSGYGILR